LHKTRTKGILLAFFNCGIIGYHKEIFNEELTQVAGFFLEILDMVAKFIIYDNACHLKPFLDSHHNLTDERLKIYETKIFAIDRIHIYNHSRKECKKFECNNFKELQNINSVVCEETNYWFSGFKYCIKHMSQERLLFFLYIIFDT
jgi:hypothetical protein